MKLLLLVLNLTWYLYDSVLFDIFIHRLNASMRLRCCGTVRISNSLDAFCISGVTYVYLVSTEVKFDGGAAVVFDAYRRDRTYDLVHAAS